jgi:hypothetical protein
MTRTGESLPTGFLGPVKGWSGLVPSAHAAIELPRERSRLAADGSSFDCIELRAVTESLGRIEPALADLTGRLVPGWRAAGRRRLPAEPAHAAPRRRRPTRSVRPGRQHRRPVAVPAVAARAAGGGDGGPVGAGRGARAVRAPRSSVPGLPASLFAHGLLPLDWLGAVPATRFWLVCQKAPTLAGSVLVAGGTPAARARTEAVLRTFLPTDWEIVVGDAPREVAGWNRAVASARGEIVWFVRGGCEPDAALFHALRAGAAIGPVAPGRDEQRAQPWRRGRA